MDILRFLTAGSVDDGKSTLIGRLLFDSKNILIDQIESLRGNSSSDDDSSIDLARLTDGLRAEREQGITIDVAYKYFSTPRRKFIIADAPGHIQYTRNMVTAASCSDLIIVLIDARHGVIEQTKRHCLISSLLCIENVVVAINKMDLVGYSEDVFERIKSDFLSSVSSLGLKNIEFIPISALLGDNIVDKTKSMPWYDGSTLLNYLETVPLSDSSSCFSRFPVQFVLRPQAEPYLDYRGYAGRIESGSFSVGDEVIVYPSEISATISKIELNGLSVREALGGQSVVFHLEQDIDISRGDIIVKADDSLVFGRDIEAVVCWMDQKPLKVGGKYFLRHNTSMVQAIVGEIISGIDINTLDEVSPYSGDTVGLNEVVRLRLKTSRPIAYDPYHRLPCNGGAILIDMTSFLTVGAVLFK